MDKMREALAHQTVRNVLTVYGLQVHGPEEHHDFFSVRHVRGEEVPGQAVKDLHAAIQKLAPRPEH